MIKYAFYKSPFGYTRIGYEDNVILSVGQIKVIDRDSYPTALTDRAASQLQEYFAGRRKTFDIPYQLQGTDFQKKVWKILCDIPYGVTRTYKEVAIAVGNPNACRAVGMANHNNPMGIVVPCHRVIGANGKLTGYAGGLDVKEALLQLEQKNK